jgi:hypothetical protein
MKTSIKLLAGIIGFVFLLLLGLRITGLNPKGPRPGLWLSGTNAKTAVADWSFSDQYPMIQVQTRPWYFVPHSVTIYCVSYENRLYLQAFGKTWKAYVLRDPRVRIKVAERLYDGTAVPVTDREEYRGVARSMTEKYGKTWPEEFYPDVYFRFASR